jgi:hypothetical protein
MVCFPAHPDPRHSTTLPNSSRAIGRNAIMGNIVNGILPVECKG